MTRCTDPRCTCNLPVDAPPAAPQDDREADPDAAFRAHLMDEPDSPIVRQAAAGLPLIPQDHREAEIGRIAGVLSTVGASAIDEMAWSPLTNPPQYEGDPDLNVIREDPYPMASLAVRLYDAGLRARPPQAPESPERA